ncbi:MAG: DUF1552 domain-containing protein [Verrucomicrobia bacterium]|nr:DUF1552 domain-containing protein [Verrucomicrobiota bacterium]
MPNLLTSRGISRRNFLRGAGLTLALPWMESIPTYAVESGKRIAAASAGQAPIRFGCLFFSNGVEPAHWWAKQTTDGMDIGPGLAPMKPFTEDFTFIRGLFNQKAVEHDSAHQGRTTNLLSGAWVSKDQSEIRVGETMDQVMAKQIGRESVIPSLVVGIEPTELRLEDGLSMIYGSNISWSTDTKPSMKEIYPSRVFDLLVGRGDRELDRSVLDEVLADANYLKTRVAYSDKQKLTDYLDSIRDIETRLDNAAKEHRLEGWRPSISEPNMERPAETLPQNIPDHMKLMLDLIVLAFQMNKTRIATCMLNNDLSQMNFGFLEHVKGSLHLDLTHNGRDPELEAMYLKTNQFHTEQCAYLLGRMKDIDEGGQSLLDNSMLMFCSNFFDGDLHQADHMPIILAGKGGGTLQPGRVLDFKEEDNSNRRACSLYLSLMDRMGVELPRFGDTTRRLAGI